MEAIEFVHGGETYDEKYPDGIPTSLTIETNDGVVHESGLIMYPSGHARNTKCDLQSILQAKFLMLGKIATDDPPLVVDLCLSIENMDSESVMLLWDIAIVDRPIFQDG